MAEHYEEQFKTTLMGGYDKEDVKEQFKLLRDSAQADKNKLTLEIEKLKKDIEDRELRIREKDKKIQQLQNDIDVKYKSYVENYDTIGKIVYETRIEANKIIKNAKLETDRLIAGADALAKERIAKAQIDVESTLADGNRRYAVLQEEINELLSLVNQIQQKFMKSVKSIQEISDAVLSDSYTDEDFDYNIDLDED